MTTLSERIILSGRPHAPTVGCEGKHRASEPCDFERRRPVWVERTVRPGSPTAVKELAR